MLGTNIIAVSGLITTVNNLAFHLTTGMASPTLNSSMSFLGADATVGVVMLLIALYLYYRKDKNVFSFVVAGIALFVIGDVIKMLVREPRPCTVQNLSWINVVRCDSSSFGFPSNHATVITGLYFFVGAYKYLRILFIAWLVLVLFGRVYMGAHYLTDVIAGVIISIIVAKGIYAYRKRINSLFATIAMKIVPPLFDIAWKNE